MVHIHVLNEPNSDPVLTEIMHLIDMPPGSTHDGWNPESARLFAIDTAIMLIRRILDILNESDRHVLLGRLHEARTLVVGSRDGELGFLQASLETHLALARSSRERSAWLWAMDALVPSPYRAALITTRNAVGHGPALPERGELLRSRLAARLAEGSLHAEPTGTLFLTA